MLKETRRTDPVLAELVERERIRQENETEKNKTNTGDPLLQSFLEYNEIRFLTQGLLIHLVNVIQVQEKDELTIVFRFHDPQTDAKG